jgi:hypothetical protein
MDDNMSSVREAIRLQIQEVRFRNLVTQSDGTTEQHPEQYLSDAEMAMTEWMKQLTDLGGKIDGDEREADYDFNVHRIIKQPLKRKAEPASAPEATQSTIKKTKTQLKREILWPRFKKRRFDCGVCLEAVVEDKIVQAGCNCRYCKKCFKQLFKTTLDNKEVPKCCGKDLPAIEHRPLLPLKTVKQYNTVKLETTTPDPVFCGDADCSRFIKPAKINGDYGTCCKCKKKTCVHCKRLEKQHVGSSKMCPMGSEDNILRGLVNKAGLKRCPHCFNVIEKISGCNSMR